MKNFPMKTFYFSLIALFLFSGCFLNTKENIDKLPDKKFVFSEFQFILLGESKENALKFYKKFPVKKIMFMLAEEYNIIIDISDFKTFLDSGNLSSIETDGTLRVAKNQWSNKSDAANRITFVFEQDYFDSSLIKFKIGMYSGKSTLKIFNAEISETNLIINRLKQNLKSGNESLKKYEEKNYEDFLQVPNIIEIKPDLKPVDDPNVI